MSHRGIVVHLQSGFVLTENHNGFVFRVISFNPFWKFPNLGNSAWDSVGVSFCSRIFWGLVGSFRDFTGLIFDFYPNSIISVTCNSEYPSRRYVTWLSKVSAEVLKASTLSISSRVSALFAFQLLSNCQLDKNVVSFLCSLDFVFLFKQPVNHLFVLSSTPYTCILKVRTMALLLAPK